MAVDDEIDFNDSMVMNYDARTRLIETSSDLVYIHEYDDYYKEYQNDGKLFDVEETTPWQGNERFQEKHRAMGSRQVIIGSVLVEHGFSGGWRHRREVCEVK